MTANCGWCQRPVPSLPELEAEARKVGQRLAYACSKHCEDNLAQREPSRVSKTDVPAGPFWDLAVMNPGKTIDIGRLVACDDCGADFTDSTVSGGFIFDNRASCPECGPKLLQRMQTRSALRFAMRAAICPESMSFADFVRSIRTDNTITVGEAR